MKLWKRTEPLQSGLLWLIGVFVLIELMLVISGKWVLVGQYESIGDDAYYSPQFYSTPATRSWRTLNCTYWTGRSTQSVELSEEYEIAPRECPFLRDAF